jgi:hypothetical protein
MPLVAETAAVGIEIDEAAAAAAPAESRLVGRRIAELGGARSGSGIVAYPGGAHE